MVLRVFLSTWLVYSVLGQPQYELSDLVDQEIQTPMKRQLSYGLDTANAEDLQTLMEDINSALGREYIPRRISR
jgi:hypothetical protein